MHGSIKDCLEAFVSDLHGCADRHAKIDRLIESIKSNSPGKWSAIRAIHNIAGDEAKNFHVVDWRKIFTPIEDFVWEEIRYNGLPFFPQFPVGNYFADFADPVKKIVIECDGRDYHNKANDCVRDASMCALGWVVFRIPGHVCNRVTVNPLRDMECDKLDQLSAQDAERISHWLNTTAEGFFYSLRSVIYSAGCVAESPLVHLVSDAVSARQSKVFQ